MKFGIYPDLIETKKINIFYDGIKYPTTFTIIQEDPIIIFTDEDGYEFYKATSYAEIIIFSNNLCEGKTFSHYKIEGN